MEDKILEKSYDYLMRYENAEKKLLGDKVFSNPKLFIVQFHIQICTMNHKI